MMCIDTITAGMLVPKILGERSLIIDLTIKNYFMNMDKEQAKTRYKRKRIQ